jgi:hypothetical protein
MRMALIMPRWDAHPDVRKEVTAMDDRDVDVDVAVTNTPAHRSSDLKERMG